MPVGIQNPVHRQLLMASCCIILLLPVVVKDVTAGDAVLVQSAKLLLGFHIVGRC